MGKWPRLDHHGEFRLIVRCSGVFVGMEIDFNRGDLLARRRKLSNYLVLYYGLVVRQDVGDVPSGADPCQSLIAPAVAKIR